MPKIQTARLRKVGNSYALTVPAETVRRLGLVTGELVGLTVQKLDIRPVLDPEIKAILDETWDEDAPALRRLAES